MLPSLTWGTWDISCENNENDQEIKKSRKLKLKIAGSQKTTKPLYEKILTKLYENGACPSYLPSPVSINYLNSWDRIDFPKSADPSAGGLFDNRLIRKRQQISNMWSCFESIICLYNNIFSDRKKELKIVEFCASSGYIAFVLAHQFPNFQFVILDMNDTSMKIANSRLKSSNLKNVRLFHGKVQDWEEKFDIGIALHACGEATDLVQEKCLKYGASYILCPCCVGKIQHSSLKYPRSSFYSKILSESEYVKLASAADFGHDNFDDFTDKQKIRRVCKSFMEIDRNKRAEENFVIPYKTHLFIMEPKLCTPKNDMIVGWPKELEISSSFIPFSNSTSTTFSSLDEIISYLFS